jgi:hypothetical protein
MRILADSLRKQEIVVFLLQRVIRYDFHLIKDKRLCKRRYTETLHGYTHKGGYRTNKYDEIALVARNGRFISRRPYS